MGSNPTQSNSSLLKAALRVVNLFSCSRTNTVVMVSGSGEVTYTERTRAVPVDLSQQQWETNRFKFVY